MFQYLIQMINKEKSLIVACMCESVGHLCVCYCAHSGLQTVLGFFIFSLKDRLTRRCSFKKNNVSWSDNTILSSLYFLVQEARDLDLVTLPPRSYSLTFHLLREENRLSITQAKARQHMLFFSRNVSDKANLNVESNTKIKGTDCDGTEKCASDVQNNSNVMFLHLAGC